MRSGCDPAGRRLAREAGGRAVGLLSSLAAMLVLCGLAPAAVAGDAATAEEPRSDHATLLRWEQKPVQLFPTAPDPPDSTASASDGRVTWDITRPPVTHMELTWAPPPKVLAPKRDGTFNDLTLTVTAKADNSGTKAHGARVMSGIFLWFDRWDSRKLGPSAKVSCWFDPDRATFVCDGPASDTKPFQFSVPSPTRVGDTFNFGVAALNCTNRCYVRYEYVAKATGQKPKPKPKRRRVGLTLDYEMGERMRVGPKGLLRHFTTPPAVSPPTYRVVLIVRRKDGKTCRAGDAFFWKANGKPIRASRTKGCRFHARLPEGRHLIRMAMKAKDGAKGATRRRVLVQDWLIFGLGDSNGAGEGDPDIAAPAFPLPGRGTWGDRRCHRSAGSYQAQAARAIERGDKRTSVTFVHLACSGAATLGGVLGRYAGIEPRTPKLRPQVNEMDRLAGKFLRKGRREIDAVLISTGVNDIGFGKLVVFCINNHSCPGAKGFNPKKPNQTLAQRTREVLKQLPRRFELLDRELKRHGVPAKHARRVYITQYYDQTRDHNEATCDPLIGSNEVASTVGLLQTLNPVLFRRLLPEGAFDRAEAEWARKEVLTPLNAAVRAAAKKHKWRVIVGPQQRFARHGVCSIDPWIVSLTGSILNQRDQFGALHANRRGNQETSKLVVKQLRKGLYPGGKPRPPAPKTPRD